jgi:hypothetical protein
MSEDKIEKIQKLEKISQSSKTDTNLAQDEELSRTPPNKDAFDNMMVHETGAAGESRRAISTTKTALIDEIGALNRRVDQVTQVSPDQIVAQSKDVIQQIEKAKLQLGTPDLELKSSVQSLMQNKLTHMDESLRIALSKAGVEYIPQQPHEVAKTSTNPIQRFLGFLSDGQYQLQTLSQDVQMMHLNGKDISPASMLAVQIKVGFVQQELEFFSSLLNKALESTKTIMNVQV